MSETATNPTEVAASGAADDKEPVSARAKAAASEAGKKVLTTANTTGDRGLSALGAGLDKAAGFVESRVSDEERRKKLERVTGGVHQAAQYLKEHDPQSVLTDVDRSIHKHPYRAMGVALVAGWVIGRLMRSD